MGKYNLNTKKEIERLITAFEDNTHWLEEAVIKKTEKHNYHLLVATHLRWLFVDKENKPFYLIEEYLKFKKEIYTNDFEKKITKFRQQYNIPETVEIKTSFFTPYICSISPPGPHTDYKKVNIEEFIEKTHIACPDNTFITPIEVIKGFANADSGAHFGKEKPTIKLLRESIIVSGGVSQFNNNDNFWGKNIIYTIGEIILELCQNMLLLIKLKHGETSFKI